MVVVLVHYCCVKLVHSNRPDPNVQLNKKQTIKQESGKHVVQLTTSCSGMEWWLKSTCISMPSRPPTLSSC